MPSKLSTPAVCDDASELEHTQMDPDDVVIRPMASDCGEDSVAKHTDRELDDSLYKSVQENPSPGIRQFALTDAVCMQLMPMPQELRKTMVTGQHVSREWLPHSLRSMTAVTTGMSVVCHVEDGDKDSDDEDSKERKRKAMDCLVSGWQLCMIVVYCMLMKSSAIQLTHKSRMKMSCTTNI